LLREIYLAEGMMRLIGMAGPFPEAEEEEEEDDEEDNCPGDRALQEVQSLPLFCHCILQCGTIAEMDRCL
jgi:hypothetical protein